LVHKGRYDYSLIEYVNYSTPVTIVCRIHGPFSQTPSNHLRGKGCRKCARNEPRSIEELIQELVQIHGGRYQYDPATFTKKGKIRVICPQHGPFTVRYSKHRKGAGCPNCTGNYQHNAKHHFERRARDVHGDKYAYGEYRGAAQKMEIVCPAHGFFFQTPASHLQGHGCPQCANDRKRLLAKGGYSEDFFILHPEMKQHSATFYVVEFVRSGECFLKVGVTRTSVKARFKSGYREYQIRSIWELKVTLFAAFTMEQAVLGEFRPKFQQFPKRPRFTGRTECLSVSCLNAILTFLGCQAKAA